MLPDEVRKAVRSLEREIADPEDCTAWQTIKAHLLAREVENARLRRMLGECYAMAGADTGGDPPERHAVDALAAVTQLRVDYDDSCGWQDRAERAEALLRKAVALLHPDTDEHKRITAHLSENSRG